MRDEIMEWFGGRDQFIKYHDQPLIKREAFG
jgi:hypothetical protein